jgi:hypothetical protein
MKALVSGKVFDADFYQQWLTSVQAEDPDAPTGRSIGTASHINASAGTQPCITTAVNFLASIRSCAMTRIMMSRLSFGRI